MRVRGRVRPQYCGTAAPSALSIVRSETSDCDAPRIAAGGPDQLAAAVQALNDLAAAKDGQELRVGDADVVAEFSQRLGLLFGVGHRTLQEDDAVFGGQPRRAATSTYC